MGSERDDEALTLKEAAERLGVKPQRISQMLADGDLEGPPVAAGQRAPKNIGRVWSSSLESELERRDIAARSESGTARRTHALEHRVYELEQLLRNRGQTDSLDQDARAAARAARAAAQRMKVALEATTESLQAEQETVASLRFEIADLREQLRAAERRHETLNTMSLAFSDSLSQLLGPDSPADA